MTIKQLCTGVLCLCLWAVSYAQNKFSVEGNGRFFSASSTNVDILNTDDNTNALIRFGDNDVLQTSLGFNGNQDAFVISMGNTLGRDDLTMDATGRIGINSMPTDHRFFIKHNSTSGPNGSSHLTLEEASSGDFNRLRFQNANEDGLWTLAARATDGDALMNVFYNDGTNFANLMSFDGDLFRVGIHQTVPDAFLHIKQNTAGVDALKFENDDATGGEIWGWRVGDNDILLYFEGALRASFNSDDGVYTNFPPPAAFSDAEVAFQEGVLTDIMKLRPLQTGKLRSQTNAIRLDPRAVERINPSWVRHSEDGQHLGIDYQQITLLAIKSIQEQQAIIDDQRTEIEHLIAAKIASDERLLALEQKIERLLALVPGASENTAHPAGPDAFGSVVRLDQNSPNPFREETTISLQLPESFSRAQIILTDLQGKTIRTFTLNQGQEQLVIQRQGLERGLYLYTLMVDDTPVATHKMVLQP
jgi:hypothetical protein